MILLAIAAALTAAAPPALGEAAHALANGRIEQARIMIGNAVKAGSSGPELDRLLADLAFVSGDFPWHWRDTKRCSRQVQAMPCSPSGSGSARSTLAIRRSRHA